MSTATKTNGTKPITTVEKSDSLERAAAAARFVELENQRAELLLEAHRRGVLDGAAISKYFNELAAIGPSRTRIALNW